MDSNITKYPSHQQNVAITTMFDSLYHLVSCNTFRFSLRTTLTQWDDLTFEFTTQNISMEISQHQLYHIYQLKIYSILARNMKEHDLTIELGIRMLEQRFNGFS